MSRNLVFLTSRNNLIRITAFGEENLKTAPAIFLVHGFKGFKDWGFGPYAASIFGRNFFVVTFNFSHNGVGESLTDFDELEKFAYSKAIISDIKSSKIDTLPYIIVKWKHNMGMAETKKQEEKLSKWLKIRLNLDTIGVIRYS